MNQRDFNCSIIVHVPAAKAIESIANVSGWWATNVQGEAVNLNDVFTVRFGKTFSTIKMVEFNPERKITWQITDSLLPLFKNPKLWEGTKIVWEVSTENNATQISFTHVGLTPDKECYSDCEKGWSFYIKQSLFNLITEGQGLPGTGIFAKISNEIRKYEGLLYFKNDPLPDYPENFIFIDVKQTQGEQVTKIYTADVYHKENFNPQQLKGDYFMIVQNTPLYNNLSPLEDILETM